MATEKSGTHDDAEAPDIETSLQAEADAVLREAAGDDVVALNSDETPDTTSDSEKIPVADLLQQLFDLSFNAMLAPRLGDHWHMGDAELKALSTSYAAVIEKYWPDLDFGVEVTAIVVTVAVIAPRVAAHKALQKADDDDAQDAAKASDRKPAAKHNKTTPKKPYSTDA